MCYSRMSSGRQPVSSTCVARSRKKRYKRNPAKVRVYVLGSFISQLFIIFVFRHDLVKSNHNRQPRLSSANRRQFPHHDIVTVHQDSLICFRELELEMASRVEENCLTQHSIVKKVPGITTGFIEIKEYFNQSIKDFVVAVLTSTSSFDPATDVCLTRGLLNYYSTNLKFSSRDHSPLMKPHRDNVNGADVAIVVGLSEMRLISLVRRSLFRQQNVVKFGMTICKKKLWRNQASLDWMSLEVLLWLFGTMLSTMLACCNAGKGLPLWFTWLSKSKCFLCWGLVLSVSSKIH